MAGWRLTSQKIQLSENDVEKACVELLRWKHYQPQRLPAGRYIMPDRAVIELCRQHNVPLRWMTIEPGMPDYVIPAWFMEVKRPGGKLSPNQELKIMDLERTWGLPVAVVESVEELIEWLNQYENH